VQPAEDFLGLRALLGDGLLLDAGEVPVQRGVGLKFQWEGAEESRFGRVEDGRKCRTPSGAAAKR